MKQKTKLTLLTSLVWTSVYFPINYLTQFRTTYTVGFEFEKLIPFIPSFVVFYLLTIPVVMTPYFFIKDNKNYKKAVKAYVALIVASGIIYLIFPVKVIRPEIIQTGFFVSIVKLLQQIELPYNALPSLHASLTTLTVLISTRYNKIFSLSLIPLWLLILLSTLFVKMHFILDLVAGIILAGIIYYLFFVRNMFSQ